MILRLRTGPRSAPRLALFDTTGLSVVESRPHDPYPVAPAAPLDRNSRIGSTLARPSPESVYYQRQGEGRFAEDLAAWEALLASDVEAWRLRRDAHLDTHHQNAAVWHGPRFFCGADGCTEDNATPVHETVEEIAAMLGGGR